MGRRVSKPRRGWFPMSAEAADLIRRGGWDYVELSDGPAAQALILGVRAKPAPADLFTVAEPEAEAEAPDPDQRDLF